MLSAAGAALFLLAFIVFHKSDSVLSAGNVAFQNGDLIFIRGRTWRSWFVRFFDAEDFSHVGIVRFVDGVPKVVHVAPEADMVRIESVGDFLSSNIDHVSVYRLKDRRFSETASMEALGYFERGISFDHRFDIFCNDKLYCTELVWLVYKRAGVDLGEGEADFLYDSVPFGKVLLPGRLSKSRRLIKVDEDTR